MMSSRAKSSISLPSVSVEVTGGGRVEVEAARVAKVEVGVAVEVAAGVGAARVGLVEVGVARAGAAVAGLVEAGVAVVVAAGVGVARAGAAVVGLVEAGVAVVVAAGVGVVRAAGAGVEHGGHERLDNDASVVVEVEVVVDEVGVLQMRKRGGGAPKYRRWSLVFVGSDGIGRFSSGLTTDR